MKYDPTRRRTGKVAVYTKIFQIILILFAFFVVVMLFFAFRQKPSIDYSKSDFVQVKEPSDDAPVVVFETTEGTFKAVLFEDEAPEYCEYFVELVEDGYFNDTYVCAVLKAENGDEAGFIGGSKTEDGLSNEDTNTKMTSIEISGNLLPIKGAIGSLVKQRGFFSKAKAGSVFTIINDVVDVAELEDSVKDKEDSNGLSKVTEMFSTYGGAPNFLQQYTIFAQVYDGWDTIEKISSMEIVDEEKSDEDEDKNYSPKEEVKFTKVYMSTYGENKENGYIIPEHTENQPSDPNDNSDGGEG